MIPEPFRTRLKQAVGDTRAIDAIHREAMQKNPHLFRLFRCDECTKPTKTPEGDLKCNGKQFERDREIACMDYKPRFGS